MVCKIRRKLKVCPNPYYINAAWFHLKRPRLKIRGNNMVDGYPIIHVSTGK